MIPKSYHEIEPGLYHDAYLGLTVQKANPAFWVLGKPSGFGASEEVLAVDVDLRKALLRAGQAAIAERKRAKVTP